MVENILESSSEKGHFQLESGYHAGLWMDLESLFLRPAALEPMLKQLAATIGQYEPALICGPLVEGAFAALSVARMLDVQFVYTVRSVANESELYPYRYSLPEALISRVSGKCVVVVNDVISAVLQCEAP
jgi:orotate phosphoribosyltransferase